MFLALRSVKNAHATEFAARKAQKQKQTHNVTIIGETRQKQYDFKQTEYFRQRIKDRYKIEEKTLNSSCLTDLASASMWD